MVVVDAIPDVETSRVKAGEQKVATLSPARSLVKKGIGAHMKLA